MANNCTVKNFDGVYDNTLDQQIDFTQIAMQTTNIDLADLTQKQGYPAAEKYEAALANTQKYWERVY